MGIELRGRTVLKAQKTVRRFLLPAMLALPLLTCGPPDSHERVVLITIDSLRPDRMTAYGGPVSLMPHLDELAQRGVVFKQASTAAPLTFPSLAGIMTGQPPSQVGVVDDRGSILSSRFPRLAPRLLDGGWATGAFVNDPDLDTNCGLMEGFRRVFNPAAETRARTESAADLFNEALDFLDHHRRLASFAWIHVHDTHYPYLGPGVSGHGEERYNTALTAADRALGVFLEGLEQKDLLKDAMIIVTADHGEGLGQTGEQTHGLWLNPPT
ncbi:MAG: sulfatase-like hydrolase/transferase, partial [Acidobacteriota bacterium]